jgi:tyrosyl-tRNA synthetase
LPANPRERQKAMALEVTRQRHGAEAALQAQVDAATLVGGAGGRGAAEAEVPEASLAAVHFPAKAFYLLSAVGICASSSEARRQIQGGGVKLDGERLADPNQEFADAAALEGKVLQLGKKTFRRLVAG